MNSPYISVSQYTFEKTFWKSSEIAKMFKISGRTVRRYAKMLEVSRPVSHYRWNRVQIAQLANKLNRRISFEQL